MARRTNRLILLGFIAGAVGVLIFHQAVILVMYLLGLVPFAPYPMRPTAPFGVPQILSLAFWGGLWGIALVYFMTSVRGADRLWVALLFGGILPTAVGLLVVGPLKGGTLALPQAQMLLRGFIINGAWGLGTALAYRAALKMLR